MKPYPLRPGWRWVLAWCWWHILHPPQRKLKEYCLLFRIACPFLFQASHINASLYVGGKGAMVISTGRGCLTLNCDATSSELFSHMFLTRYANDWLMFYEKNIYSIWNECTTCHWSNQMPKKTERLQYLPRGLLVEVWYVSQRSQHFLQRVKLQGCT